MEWRIKRKMRWSDFNHDSCPAGPRWIHKAGRRLRWVVGKGGSFLSATAMVFFSSPRFLLATIPTITKHLFQLALSTTVQLPKLVHIPPPTLVPNHPGCSAHSKCPRLCSPHAPCSRDARVFTILQICTSFLHCLNELTFPSSAGCQGHNI